MTRFSVSALVGSLRKESCNLRLARAIAALGKDRFDVRVLEIGDLPLYNQDIENPLPASVARLKAEIQGADALLFVTPEFNRSIPGPLKNAIDWASRPYGASAFAGKPGAVCGTSPGPIGTACAQQALRPVLGHLDVALMGQPEMYFQFKGNAIDAHGAVSEDSARTVLKGFVDRYAQWVERHLACATPDARRACCS